MTQDAAAGRYIPADVKREVRRRSSFGCVICGLPIYHYEHIEDFAGSRQHAADDMVLLCPTHHQDKTSGRITREVLRSFQRSPSNASRDQTSSHRLLMQGDAGEFNIGSNVFRTQLADGSRFEAVVLKGKSVLGVRREGDFLILNASLTDSSGSPILTIEDGELKVATSVWDFRLEGRNLRIAAAEGGYFLEAVLTQNGMIVNRGLLINGGAGIEIEPTHLKLLPFGPSLSRCGGSGATVGIMVG